MADKHYTEWSREAKDELARQRMEAMRKKNEELKKRHAEVEADKRNAEILSCSVTVAKTKGNSFEKTTADTAPIGRGRRLQQLSQGELHAKGDIPPPDPSFRFLDDPLRTKGSSESRSQGSRRHYSNFGGHDFSNVKETMQKSKQFEKEHPLEPPQNKMEMSLVMTGKERKNYEQWKAERQQIDEERIERQKNSAGSWKREWDLDKELQEKEVKSPSPFFKEPNWSSKQCESQRRGRYNGRSYMAPRQRNQSGPSSDNEDPESYQGRYKPRGRGGTFASKSQSGHKYSGSWSDNEDANLHECSKKRPNEKGNISSGTGNTKPSASGTWSDNEDTDTFHGKTDGLNKSHGFDSVSRKEQNYQQQSGASETASSQQTKCGSRGRGGFSSVPKKDYNSDNWPTLESNENYDHRKVKPVGRREFSSALRKEHNSGNRSDNEDTPNYQRGRGKYRGRGSFSSGHKKDHNSSNWHDAEKTNNAQQGNRYGGRDSFVSVTKKDHDSGTWSDTEDNSHLQHDKGKSKKQHNHSTWSDNEEVSSTQEEHDSCNKINYSAALQKKPQSFDNWAVTENLDIPHQEKKPRNKDNSGTWSDVVETVSDKDWMDDKGFSSGKRKQQISGNWSDTEDGKFHKTETVESNTQDIIFESKKMQHSSSTWSDNETFQQNAKCATDKRSVTIDDDKILTVTFDQQDKHEANEIKNSDLNDLHQRNKGPDRAFNRSFSEPDKTRMEYEFPQNKDKGTKGWENERKDHRQNSRYTRDRGRRSRPTGPYHKGAREYSDQNQKRFTGGNNEHHDGGNRFRIKNDRSRRQNIEDKSNFNDIQHWIHTSVYKSEKNTVREQNEDSTFDSRRDNRLFEKRRGGFKAELNNRGRDRRGKEEYKKPPEQNFEYKNWRHAKGDDKSWKNLDNQEKIKDSDCFGENPQSFNQKQDNGTWDNCEQSNQKHEVSHGTWNKVDNSAKYPRNTQEIKLGLRNNGFRGKVDNANKNKSWQDSKSTVHNAEDNRMWADADEPKTLKAFECNKTYMSKTDDEGTWGDVDQSSKTTLDSWGSSDDSQRKKEWNNSTGTELLKNEQHIASTSGVTDVLEETGKSKASQQQKIGSLQITINAGSRGVSSDTGAWESIDCSKEFNSNTETVLVNNTSIKDKSIYDEAKNKVDCSDVEILDQNYILDEAKEKLKDNTEAEYIYEDEKLCSESHDDSWTTTSGGDSVLEHDEEELINFHEEQEFESTHSNDLIIGNEASQIIYRTCESPVLTDEGNQKTSECGSIEDFDNDKTLELDNEAVQETLQDGKCIQQIENDSSFFRNSIENNDKRILDFVSNENLNQKTVKNNELASTVDSMSFPNEIDAIQTVVENSASYRVEGNDTKELSDLVSVSSYSDVNQQCENDNVQQTVHENSKTGIGLEEKTNTKDLFVVQESEDQTGWTVAHKQDNDSKLDISSNLEEKYIEESHMQKNFKEKGPPILVLQDHDENATTLVVSCLECDNFENNSHSNDEKQAEFDIDYQQNQCSSSEEKTQIQLNKPSKTVSLSIQEHQTESNLQNLKQEMSANAISDEVLNIHVSDSYQLTSVGNLNQMEEINVESGSVKNHSEKETVSILHLTSNDEECNAQITESLELVSNEVESESNSNLANETEISVKCECVEADSGRAEQVGADSETAEQICADSGTAEQICADSGTAEQICADSGTAEQICTDSVAVDTDVKENSFDVSLQNIDRKDIKQHYVNRNEHEATCEHSDEDSTSILNSSQMCKLENAKSLQISTSEMSDENNGKGEFETAVTNDIKGTNSETDNNLHPGNVATCTEMAGNICSDSVIEDFNKNDTNLMPCINECLKSDTCGTHKEVNEEASHSIGSEASIDSSNLEPDGCPHSTEGKDSVHKIDSVSDASVAE